MSVSYDVSRETRDGTEYILVDGEVENDLNDYVYVEVGACGWYNPDCDDDIDYDTCAGRENLWLCPEETWTPDDPWEFDTSRLRCELDQIALVAENVKREDFCR